MADQFPQEVIYEIFSRTPIKSLARFQCVCKLWLNYINDPYLETIHVEAQPTPIMFQRVYGTLDARCRVSFLRSIQWDPVFEFKVHTHTIPVVLGSCNGLALVGCQNKNKPIIGSGLAVINPLTKRYDDLPQLHIRYGYIDYYRRPEATGIGFDDSINTLKTVCVIHKTTITSMDINVVRKQLRTMVYNSGMKVWREIAQIPDYPITGEGVFAHGRLHWLANGKYCCLPYDAIKIVWFNVKTEKFGLIDPPRIPKGADYRSVRDRLVDLNGEVGFAYMGGHIELWILKHEEWLLHCRIDNLRTRPSDYNDVLVSGCWNKDGDILLTSNGASRLFLYTLKTDNLREVVKWDPYRYADIRMYRSGWFSTRSIKN